MAKQLITTANLDTYIRKDLGKLFVTPDRLVTAGVKDELRRRGVQLVYGPEPAPVQPVCCSAPQADGADKLKRDGRKPDSGCCRQDSEGRQGQHLTPAALCLLRHRAQCVNAEGGVLPA